MKRTTKWGRTVLAIAFVLAFVPGVAFASTSASSLHTGPTSTVIGMGEAEAESEAEGAPADASGSASDGSSPVVGEVAGGQLASVGLRLAGIIGEEMAQVHGNKLLAYDPALIAQIGTQESTGHTICCPSFSCAYADAVMDGTVHDHGYYTCTQCSWTDWGGGNSAFRCVGTDEELLREAYDQISAGRPTVIHVAASYGEHWIALIGYENATDPDHLTLSNFIALDPWNGAQVNAGDSFSLYGDGCEHISDR